MRAFEARVPYFILFKILNIFMFLNQLYEFILKEINLIIYKEYNWRYLLKN